jgi:S-adenosylmethionine hydrolase
VSTFDGRDVLAPAAARLALGEDPDAVGERVAPASLVPLVLPDARVEQLQVSAEVVHVDGFGNLQLSAPSRLQAEAGIAPWVKLVDHRRVELHELQLRRGFMDISATTLPPDRHSGDEARGRSE